MVKPLTKSQATVLMVMTGICLMDGPSFRREIGKRLGRDPEPSEFGTQSFVNELQELYHGDFLEMCNLVEDSGLILPQGAV